MAQYRYDVFYAIDEWMEILVEVATSLFDNVYLKKLITIMISSFNVYKVVHVASSLSYHSTIN